jgi:hypothetical protein
MAARLAAFLSQAAARGFVWGAHDCMLFAADWARDLTGRDPAARWRGTYADEAAAREIMRGAGGPVALVQDALEACGWGRAVQPGEAAGDIVLCVPPHHGEPMAGIVTPSGRTALLTRTGLVLWPVPAMWAWHHA